MYARHLTPELEALALHRNKMAFISGPRQCGKTTLAKSLLRDPELYFSWDQLKFRQLWAKSPDHLADMALAKRHPRIVLDELHKNQRWKRQLKGFYDDYGQNIEILITGSARLDTYRKGGDSLLGRFYHFHLHPFSLAEVTQILPNWKVFEQFLKTPELKTNATLVEATQALLHFGSFPEPFLGQRQEILNLWQKNRAELLIRQDLRDLSQIQEISQVETLLALLPSKIGAPMSVQSLREDLEVAFTTVKRWLQFLEALYIYFEVKPYTKSIARSLKKEGKIYLYDWSVIESEGPRFENMVAHHLLTLCNHWTDTGVANLELHYLRNKEKFEVDFLITKNKIPFFTVEVKLRELNLDRSFQVFQRTLKVPHFQIVLEPGILRKLPSETGPAWIVSFETFFSHCP